MVETCRCPKASYSVLSICCGRIPSREAVSRSITSSACRPPFCWSLATSRSSGRVRSLSTSCEDSLVNSFGVRIFHRVLELGAADAVFHRQILHRLHDRA